MTPMITNQTKLIVLHVIVMGVFVIIEISMGVFVIVCNCAPT